MRHPETVAYHIEWENVISGATGIVTGEDMSKTLEFEFEAEAQEHANDLQTERNGELGLTPEDGDIYLYEAVETAVD